MPERARNCVSETHLSHQIDRSATNLMLEIVPLDHADPVLASGCTFHFDGTFYHAMNKVFCKAMFLVVIENDGCASQSRSEHIVCSEKTLTMKISVTDMSNNSSSQAAL